MKNDKLKKWSLRIGVVFFALLLFLTYFSGTIDTMLLPKVKTAEVIRGTLVEQENPTPHDNRFLVPISSVTGFGDSGVVYVVSLNYDGTGHVVNTVNVQILDSDEMYYEVTASDLYGGNQVVYRTSKAISDGDRVYLEEG